MEDKDRIIRVLQEQKREHRKNWINALERIDELEEENKRLKQTIIENGINIGLCK